MKKKLLFCLTLLCLAALLLCACAKSDEGGEPTDTDTEIDLTALKGPEKTVTLFGDSENFVIVYPQKGTEALKKASTEFARAVQEASGKKPMYYSDNTEKNAEIATEILIGPTNRAQSATVLDAINTSGYRIEFIDEKLVVHATSDFFLEKALIKLTELWTAEDKVLTLSSHTLENYDGSAEVLDLYEGENFRYQIIAPIDLRYEAAQKASVTLADRLKYLKLDVKPQYDEKVEETEDACEIVFGNAARDISDEALDQTGYFDYRISIAGNRIVVSAHIESRFEPAAQKLYKVISAAVEGTYKGVPQIPRDYEYTEAASEFANNIPLVDGGRVSGIYDAMNETYVVTVRDVAKAEYDAYIKTLNDSSFATKETYTLGSNSYTLTESDMTTVYVSYLPASEEIRVFAEEKGVAYPSKAPTVVSGAYTPKLWQLEIDCDSTDLNGGMSYVMQGADGSFLIVDGGYKDSKDAERLYTLLRENTPEGKKPVIAGWFFTHLHGDHYGCFQTFAPTYGKEVELKAIYANFPGSVISGTDHTVNTGFSSKLESTVSAVSGWKDCVFYTRLHSGMTFSVAGMGIEVFCTHEDVYFEKNNGNFWNFADGNDTCTVFRVTSGGKTVMFLGDAREGQDAAILRNFGKAGELKSDIVQQAHHGYEGVSKECYQAIGAATVLWPMPILDYQGTYSTPYCYTHWRLKDTPPCDGNEWAVNSDVVKKIIVSGIGTVELSLPTFDPLNLDLPFYDSKTAKEPNWQAVYEAKKDENHLPTT